MLPYPQISSFDCLRASVASLLEIDPETLPDFSTKQDRWFESLQVWLQEKGLWSLAVRERDVDAYLRRNTPWIRIELPENRMPHATMVISKGQAVWDPRNEGRFDADRRSDEERISLLILQQDLKRNFGVLDRDQFVETLRGWRKMGHQTVMTNGVFDLLHQGHVKALEEASRQGDRLAVAVNSDASVKAIKEPGRPLIPEDQRASMVASLRYVDAVCLFDELTPLEIISSCLPKVLVKGSDWEGNVVGADVVEDHGGRTHLVQRVEDLLSTTSIIEKIRNYDERERRP